MQTFLPNSSFTASAKCLDYRRLGKQRVEAWQIYQAITNSEYGWQNHPIVNMWRPYKQALLVYGISICLEWKNRGYKDTMLKRFTDELLTYPPTSPTLPSWIGKTDLHDSHKSNLLRKDKKYYSQFKWKVSDTLPYVWYK